MKKEQINTIIATHIFGLKPGIDFGEIPEHDWYKIEYLEFIEDNHSVCTRCGVSYYEFYDNKPSTPCMKKPPNYLTEDKLWVILEKLKEHCLVNIEISKAKVLCTLKSIHTNEINERFHPITVQAKTLPEAVCLAVVEMFQMQDKK